MRTHLKTPPLGWNSFDSFGCYISWVEAEAQLDAFARVLAPSGYEYFILDSGWYGEFKLTPGTLLPDPNHPSHAAQVRLDEYGRWLPSYTYFNGEFASLIKKTHDLGLKFGLHLMRGISRQAVEQRLPIKGSDVTCDQIADRESVCSWCAYNYGVDMAQPGAQAYHDSIYDLLAEWEVDFVKVDDVTFAPAEIKAHALAIERCGREIVLSLSPGDSTEKTLLPAYYDADMVRITKDIWDDLESIARSFIAWEHWCESARIGFWPDLDMIPFGRLQLKSPPPVGHSQLPNAEQTALAGKGWTRDSQLSPSAKRTFATQRIMAASPLMVGGDLNTLSAEELRLLTEPRAIACNQNGVSARPIYLLGDVQVWHVVDQKNANRGWLGLFNRNLVSTAESITLSPDRIGLSQDTQLSDIWNDTELGELGEAMTIQVPAEGVIFLAYCS